MSSGGTLPHVYSTVFGRTMPSLPVIVSAAEAARRHLKRSDYVACVEAFIDCRLPGSMPKENFSMIGPGVTQNASQVINLREPHGFNVGAAGMYPGITNNLHLHFTSETFIVPEGSYLLRWGVKGDEGELLLEAGDIAVMPTWAFRGFSAVGENFGLLFTVLGGDDTGGIIWSPDVLTRARETGLWLSRDNEVIDSLATGHPPEPDALLPLMPEADIATLKRWSTPEMLARVVKKTARDFRAATLDTAAGYHWQLAPAVGNGLSQHRAHVPPVLEPQSFSIDWMRITPGGASASFLIAEKMVVINLSPALEVTLNTGDDTVRRTLAFQEMMSIPAHVTRAFRCPGNEGNIAAEAVLIVAGDHVKRPQFSQAVIDAAFARDVALDAAGKLARASLLPPSLMPNVTSEATAEATSDLAPRAQP
jgi:quercetin dioxygenase-like cupin family protein